MKSKSLAHFVFTFVLIGLMVILSISFLVAEKKSKNPTVTESEKGEKTLVLPDELQDFLASEIPGYQIPKESDFNPEMLKYYYSRLIGIYPALASGDFNLDRKRDYALLVITGQSKWGPLMELVILNGGKKSGAYEVFRVGEVYSFKDDYISFDNGKLYKGKYQKGGWFINWDGKKGTYTKLKS